jgi:hypothetical protein
MTIRIICGVVFLAAAYVCALTAGLMNMDLDFQVNDQLPPERRVKPNFLGTFNRWEMDRLQKEIFPEKRKRIQKLTFVGFALFFTAIGVFLY